MLGMRHYTKAYIAACRSRVDADVAVYRKARVAAEKAGVDSKRLGALETAFFNNMVLVLDHLFVHRLRMVEGKDGNALNEVRVLGDSMMLHAGVMTDDKGIKMPPAKSVLKYEAGDEIAVTEEQFSRLAEAYFEQIEEKFL